MDEMDDEIHLEDPFDASQHIDISRASNSQFLGVVVCHPKF